MHPHPVPGYTDVWNLVNSPSLRRAAHALSALRPRSASEPAPHPAHGEQSETAERGVHHRRALRLGAVAATGIVLAGGSIATANAHKTVTLDIDGRSTEISTFAGSIDGLLEDHGVEVGERDLVAPASGSALNDGDEVVVRHAHPLVVETDGQEKTVWTTALSADEALANLTARGEQVRLLPSRSLASGRADLALPLTLEGQVDVVADGQTRQVDGGTLTEVLTSLDITLGGLDRVRVEQPDGRVTVVVERVVAQEQSVVAEVPFESVTEQTDTLFTGQTRTAVAGAPGERTTVHRVVLVDGVEESRVLLSDAVTRAPVTEVVRQGTKARPVAPKPAAPVRAPAPSAAAAPAAPVVTGDVWAALARCESGGNPTIVSRNGLYYGLYQFSLGTWQGVGGSGLPSEASPEEQTQRAQALQARSGWGQWPACAAKLGLL